MKGLTHDEATLLKEVLADQCAPPGAGLTMYTPIECEISARLTLRGLLRVVYLDDLEDESYEYTADEITPLGLIALRLYNAIQVAA